MIVESICREYSRLDFLCRKLKMRDDVYETWFFNGRLHIKTTPNSKRIQVSQIQDLYERFGKPSIDDILSAPRKLT